MIFLLPLLAGMLFVTPEFCHLLFLVELTMALAECLDDDNPIGHFALQYSIKARSHGLQERRSFPACAQHLAVPLIGSETLHHGR